MLDLILVFILGMNVIMLDNIHKSLNQINISLGILMDLHTHQRRI